MGGRSSTAPTVARRGLNAVADDPASVCLRCGGKAGRCRKLLGYLYPPTPDSDGDPWIVLEWRAKRVCMHDTDPLSSLDRRSVDELLKRGEKSEESLLLEDPGPAASRVMITTLV
jgi:hypothetical protein